jgi:hypothetical protein
MGNTIKSDLIVFYDGAFLVLIKNVRGFRSMDSVLKEYAEKYAFNREDLKGIWVNHSFLDYGKDILGK